MTKSQITYQQNRKHISQKALVECTVNLAIGSAVYTLAFLSIFVTCRYSILIRNIFHSSYLHFCPKSTGINHQWGAASLL